MSTLDDRMKELQQALTVVLLMAGHEQGNPLSNLDGKLYNFQSACDAVYEALALIGSNPLSGDEARSAEMQLLTEKLDELERVTNRSAW